MNMDWQTKTRQFLHLEWERLLAAMAALTAVLALILATLTVIGWFQQQEPRPSQNAVASSAFSDHALRYMEPAAPDSDIGKDGNRLNTAITHLGDFHAASYRRACILQVGKVPVKNMP